MRVLTENEILIQKGSNMDHMYSPFGENIIKKAKGLVGSGKVKGVLGALGVGGLGAGQSVSPAPASAPAPEKKKMSKTTKIMIGVGAALVLGGIIFFVMKKKKK